MGFYAKNQAKIERVYGEPRKLVASVYDEVLAEWETKEFEFNQLYAALAWIEQGLMRLDM
jgi:hypothetical protein